eukprot:8509858-Karenia_brevis.AAC.1
MKHIGTHTADIDMGQHGMPPTSPQLPPTDALLKTNKEIRELRELHQKLVGEFGEDYHATVIIKERADALESKVSPVKTLSNHQQ